MVERLNFTQIEALVVDADQYSTQILGQILRGFGLSRQIVIESGEEAKRRLGAGHFDLLICDAILPDTHASDLIKWIRRQPALNIKYMPIVVLTGYTQFSNVVTLRDSGANIVVRKPVSPNVLFDHIAWSARTERPFIETDNFIGPDRRFKNTGPPDGAGRRKTDMTADIGAALEPNMSQDEIDNLLKPTKVEIE
ncbi:MAG: response regulator [Rhizomicrobium sp.]|nr:response regulator [Rhizomicrobium sp.]